MYISILTENQKRLLKTAHGGKYFMIRCLNNRLILIIIAMVVSFSLDCSAFSLNADSIASKGKFPKFCINSLRWFERTFNPADTAYIRGSGYEFNVKLRSSHWMDFNNFYFDSDHRIRMESPFCNSIGFSIQYSIISLGYDVNMDKLFGGADRSSSKFNFEFSTARISGRIYSIRNNEGMNITAFDRERDMVLHYGGIETSTWGIDFTYFFNPRRYSNSAAFSFGKIQRKSCGSFMGGIAFQSQKRNFDFSRLPEPVETWLPDEWRGKNYADNGYNIGLSGGYGFNWVPGKNWTIGIVGMLIPSINYGYLNSERKGYSFRINYRLNFGTVWNHKQWFIGVTVKTDESMVYSHSTLASGLLNIESKLGFRFNLFKSKK